MNQANSVLVPTRACGLHARGLIYRPAPSTEDILLTFDAGTRADLDFIILVIAFGRGCRCKQEVLIRRSILVVWEHILPEERPTPVRLDFTEQIGGTAVAAGSEFKDGILTPLRLNALRRLKVESLLGEKLEVCSLHCPDEEVVPGREQRRS